MFSLVTIGQNATSPPLTPLVNLLSAPGIIHDCPPRKKCFRRPWLDSTIYMGLWVIHNRFECKEFLILFFSTQSV